MEVITRFADTAYAGPQMLQGLNIDDSEKIIISDLIATPIFIEMLPEEIVKVSYRLLRLQPVTLDDDPEGKHDWRTYTTSNI